MTEKHITVVDFIVRGEADGNWKMVIVEEGPWTGPLEVHLRRIQNRLYECLDAALDGQLAEKFPGSKGKRLTITLDCYNVPKVEVSAYFERFSKNVLNTHDYKNALQGNKYVPDIAFEVTFDSIH